MHLSLLKSPSALPNLQLREDVRELIRKMSQDDPLWSAPRVHGELLKLGIEVSQSTVSKYMVRHRKPPSQSWRTFLKNHAKDTVSIDFFTVPTAAFHVLYVFLVLLHDRREVIHFNVTDSPSAFWTGQQIVQAFPWDTTPRYLLRDRDGKYGEEFIRRVESMGIEHVLISAQSPWQTPFVERIIGSIRRECLDHVIVFNEKHLRRVLTLYPDVKVTGAQTTWVIRGENVAKTMAAEIWIAVDSVEKAIAIAESRSPSGLFTMAPGALVIYNTPPRMRRSRPLLSGNRRDRQIDCRIRASRHL